MRNAGKSLSARVMDIGQGSTAAGASRESELIEAAKEREIWRTC